jgi:excisionase family DNA binding protein
MAADGLDAPLLAEHLPRLLSMADVADVLGLSIRTVRRMVSMGELPIVRLNNRTVRFRPEDVKALIDRGYVSPNAQ